MSTAISPARPPTFQRGSGRIVERTTTITREIFLDGPTPLQAPAESESESRSAPKSRSETEISDGPIRGIDRAMVRLGVWLIEAGRRHALRPSANADDIARRVDTARAHDMKHFIGLPC